MSWLVTSGMIVGFAACEPLADGRIGTDGSPPFGALDEAALDITGDLDEGSGEPVPKIVNGIQDPGHPSVGALTTNGGACTATLIGRRTVLTARHCVDGGGLAFAVGGVRYAATALAAYPGSSLSTDIALVFLGQQPAGVVPSTIGVDPVQRGQTITLVGYGRTSEQGGGFGTKRQGQNWVSSYTQTSFSFGGQSSCVCNGDSGGPSFVTIGGKERVAGVHSTKAGVCGAGGTDIRVDAFKSWIQQVAGNDVSLPGATPTNPSSPGGQTAREGESCAQKSCGPGLACTTVFQPSTMQPIGKHCLERCQFPGAQDPICNGGERCTQSRTAGPVCFNPNNSTQGFTDP